MKYFNKFDEIPLSIPLKQDIFEKECQDLGVFNFIEFYNSNVFRHKNKIKDKEIICNISD